MDIKALQAVALSVRTLSMDAVQKANSGHPGLPMGCAELGALLYGEILNHNPADPAWLNRDRFVLSAGHGSMFLYSLLHLAGYDLGLEEIKNFRQLGSKTPGHPEYGHTAGVETTTGPLGQGVSNAVGLAIGETMLAARFNTANHPVIDHRTYVLAGDGCMMEGISSESASLAGHLKLGKLIVFYDSNHITIEGHTELAFTEDTARRYEAYGWQVQKGDAHDFNAVMKMVERAREDTERPSLIILSSVIGKGSPNKAGTHEVHGAPLGLDEIRATRRNLGVGEDAEFFIHPDARSYFAAKRSAWTERYTEWQALFRAWSAENPALRQEFDLWRSERPAALANLSMPVFKAGDKVATRSASGKALSAAARALPNLVGGSADLAPSNNTALPEHGDYSAANRTGRTFHFGVREHAMGAIANGLALYGGLRPFCATFMVFSDYMKPAVRLAALMKLPVIYVFTHDSIFVGEDGPTHQPIEHLAALRVIPGLLVLRPGDAEETAQAWLMALRRTQGPTALALTRQNLEVYAKPADWRENAERGAYAALDCAGQPDVVVLATGSEVSLAVSAARACPQKKVRVVSMLSRELFMAQPADWRRALLPPGIRTIVAEVGVSFGWEGFVRDASDLFTIDSFGVSGPAGKVAEHFGRTQASLERLIQS